MALDIACLLTSPSFASVQEDFHENESMGKIRCSGEVSFFTFVMSNDNVVVHEGVMRRVWGIV